MAFRNQNLFSANYLVRRLPETALWREVTMKAEKAFGEVKAAYERIRGLKLGVGEEANLEDKFIRPVIKALEFDYDVQPVTQRGPRKKRPDYALFVSHKELKEGKKHKGNLKRFFSRALTIAEAKYWGRALNDTDRKDTLDSRDPTAQLIKYLDDVYHHSEGKILWGVLTNGKVWRLFYYRATSRSGNFYEVDLEEIIQSGDVDSFKYFHLFFAKDAFVQDTRTGKSWLDQHLEGSGTYAKEVSEKLKDRIFDQVFEHLAEGFLEHRRVERGLTAENQDTLQQVFNGCLTLLYRLLFLLYAESRELLPVQDQHRYYRNSLRKLQRDIVADLQTVGLEGMSHKAFNYWARLESLCRIIDKGDRALNVPIYNGGLFQSIVPDEDKRPEADAIRFVRDHKLADPHLARAIFLLTVDESDTIAQDKVQFIDYSSLGVRHLGEIYEGLLEFSIRIAEEEVFEVREKGRSVWKDAHEIKGEKTYRRKQPGEVYIENSRHERRATGSFYTPHCVVEYIVKHTVGPVLEGRFETVRRLLQEVPRLEKERTKAPAKARPLATAKIEAQKEEIFETLFSLRILDPAMGSGHFLVHAVDFAADRLVSFLADFPDNPVISRIEEMRQQILDDVRRQGVEIDGSKLTEVNLIKRMVMKRCIYGVDLNPMAVELAKLSLWLDSFTLGAPLSFLDHHLRCGNSLIGAWVDEVQKAMEERSKDKQRLLFGTQFAGLLSATEMMRAVGELTDATFDEVQRSFDLYKRADEALAPFKGVLDLWVSHYFGNEGASYFLGKGGDVASLLRTPERLPREDQKLVGEANRIKQAKRFFHWELEFPEVYYEKAGKRAHSGFDAVIGNPPYGIVFDEMEKDWLEEKFRSFIRNNDLYTAFTELSVTLTRPRGLASMIIPNTFILGPYFKAMKQHLLDLAVVRQALDFGFTKIFPDPEVYSAIYVAQRKADADEIEIKSTLAKAYIASNSITLEHPIQVDISSAGEDEWKIFHPIVHKVRLVGIKLKDICFVKDVGLNYWTVGRGKKRGGSIGSRILYDGAKRHPRDIAFLKGGDFGSYELPEPGQHWLRHNYQSLLDPDVDVFRFSPEFLQVPLKLIYRQTADTLICSIDETGSLVDKTVHVAMVKDKNNPLNPYYLLALLNSTLLAFVYSELSEEEGRAFAQVKAFRIKKLPIRRINFTVSEKERTRLLEKGKALYKRCMAKGDRLCVTGFVEHCLAQKPEEADVVHDLLAFLAECMIEMNKKKQAEVKGFLEWLEREIEAKVEDLTNKTKIKEYHESSLEDLLEVFKANRKKLGIDPSRREFSERLKDEFNRSLAKIRPLKDRLVATDRLIDQIVYQLYGLSEDEIRIIEASSA